MGGISRDGETQQMDWQKSTFPSDPIPLSHPKVVTGNHGRSIDGQIFPTDKWSVSGKTNPDDASCKDEEGGDVFYGYLSSAYKGSKWKQSSSNTGFTLTRGVAMYFVIDSEANGYWVVTVDTPGNSKFGNDRQVFR